MKKNEFVIFERKIQISICKVIINKYCNNIVKQTLHKKVFLVSFVQLLFCRISETERHTDSFRTPDSCGLKVSCDCAPPYSFAPKCPSVQAVTKAFTYACCWHSNSQSCVRGRYGPLTGNGKNKYLCAVLQSSQHESNVQSKVHVS